MLTAADGATATMPPPKKKPAAKAKPAAAPPAPPAGRRPGWTKPTNMTLGEATLADLEAIRAHLAAITPVPGGRGPTITDAVRYAARQVAAGLQSDNLAPRK